MPITLPQEQESLVAEKVRSRSYLNPEHVTAEALQLLAARDQRVAELETLRQDIEAAWRAADEGQLLDGPAAM
ncbi:MAG TPA: hypothetical protein PKE47_02840, partial [Verrucomicrobiota bacterium]|nr:hypothetical protein [Verrucomicrobiota bacterium]